MPPRVPPRRPGDRHLPRGCSEVPGEKVRIPESLLPGYVQLKHLLGPTIGHADVFRFLFETAETRIERIVQENLSREVPAEDTPDGPAPPIECDGEEVMLWEFDSYLDLDVDFELNFIMLIFLH
ncbi:hypothetical protein R1sor_019035 [Riccia sorocarpa]|uniref:Uncharacterized protein n=1 Tax=Riccia sorocarpa TaxID=122646 RepID=A0ABD3IBH8_9MARC